MLQKESRATFKMITNSRQKQNAKTHIPTKVRAAMGAVSNDAQSSLVALLLGLELATLLGRHVLAGAR